MRSVKAFPGAWVISSLLISSVLAAYEPIPDVGPGSGFYGRQVDRPVTDATVLTIEREEIVILIQDRLRPSPASDNRRVKF